MSCSQELQDTSFEKLEARTCRTVSEVISAEAQSTITELRVQCVALQAEIAARDAQESTLRAEIAAQDVRERESVSSPCTDCPALRARVDELHSRMSSPQVWLLIPSCVGAFVY